MLLVAYLLLVGTCYLLVLLNIIGQGYIDIQHLIRLHNNFNKKITFISIILIILNTYLIYMQYSCNS